jgi:hypothetical protein
MGLPAFMAAFSKTLLVFDPDTQRLRNKLIAKIDPRSILDDLRVKHGQVKEKLREQTKQLEQQDDKIRQKSDSHKVPILTISCSESHKVQILTISCSDSHKVQILTISCSDSHKVPILTISVLIFRVSEQALRCSCDYIQGQPTYCIWNKEFDLYRKINYSS